MFTSPANVFRVRQSVADLRAYLRDSGSAVRQRLSAQIAGSNSESSSLDRVVDDQGARFSLPSNTDVYDACVLAAALPSDDYPLFTFATALLLTDRLQGGGGPDDLYWNWESFRSDYELADPPVRSAILNGFRAGMLSGTLQIEGFPDPDLCMTRSRDDVLRLSVADPELSGLVVGEASADEAGREWEQRAGQDLSATETAVFRYLYERPVSISPAHPTRTHLIPWSGL